MTGDLVVTGELELDRPVEMRPAKAAGVPCSVNVSVPSYLGPPVPAAQVGGAGDG